MDMSNVPTGEIIISHVNVEPINTAIKERAKTLAEQLNPEAASQFESDMGSYECYAEGHGTDLLFGIKVSESYLINYLKSHGTPVSGGEDGVAHNVDGSTYTSRVPRQLQGTPLPELELPVIDGEEEAQQLLAIMAPDAAHNAIAESKTEIQKAIVPSIQKEIYQMFGGDSQ